jgi:hypothetical protein
VRGAQALLGGLGDRVSRDHDSCRLRPPARTPEIPFRWESCAVLLGALLVALVGCGLALWRVTKFN